MSKQTTIDNLTAQEEPTGSRVFSRMVTRTTYLADVNKALEKFSETHIIIKNTPDKKFIDNLDLIGEGTSSSEEVQ